MVDGLREGPWVYYNERNGKTEAKGSYKNDELSGSWQFYRPDGRIKEVKNFDDPLVDVIYDYE